MSCSNCGAPLSGPGARCNACGAAPMGGGGGGGFGQPTSADPSWQSAMGQPRAGDADYQAAMGQPTAADPSFQQAMGQPHASPQTYGAPPAGYGMQPGGGMQAPLAKKGCCGCLGVLMLAIGGGVVAFAIAVLL